MTLCCSGFIRWIGFFCAVSLLGVGGVGCSSDEGSLFERRRAAQTGVEFNNAIVENDTLLNPLDYEYVYNGGGVAAGDLTGNGRPDLYFAGNVVPNRLYVNRGEFRFEDVTDTASVAADGVWSTGVSLVDINQDGLLDIYVCVGGPPERAGERANRLYVNQGVDDEGRPSFEERAEAYGIADTSYSVHAAFFDYDRDGDLDLYLLTTEMQETDRNAIRPRRTEGGAPNTDRLYRNDAPARSGSEQTPTFTDVSEEAGIQTEGHGLGVAISDINKDGWPDIYVANDFISNDLLYVNETDSGSTSEQRPTFTNRIDKQLKHQAYSAMGVDVADFNNDAWADIFVLDMLPPDRRRNQLMSRFFERHSFQGALRFNYEPQYVRNMLQLNNGPSPQGELAFSEIGQLAGVEATDWSWAPLFVDLTNDGKRDLFVTNGYGKDVTDLDFVHERERILAFGTDEAQREQLRKAMTALPEVHLPNVLFENEGDLTFTERTGKWAANPPGLSNGAAVADLDGDGDLDLVTNNINDEATILENRASEQDSSNALRIEVYGPSGNRGGLGTKLTLYNDGSTQYYEHYPYRGYQSTVEPIAHFGMGADTTADSLQVVWPDGSRQVMTDVAAGQVLDVRYEAASGPQGGEPSSGSAARAPESDSLRFGDVAPGRGLAYRHEEHTVDEFERTPLLPHKLSMEGPGVAVGDVDGNGRDDVFIGADRSRRPVLFRQDEAGQFRRDTLAMDPRFEDRGALFFDADGDGDRDLYVVSGGPVRAADSTVYQDRLYLNDGEGAFERAEGALPEIGAAGSVVTAADYDSDGDLDLFIGGRVRPGAYPLPPRSYLLRNDSEGGDVRFTDVTETVAPGLSEAGLVTDALWTDYDGDGDRDLMVVGEWMPITLFENGDDGFTEVTKEVDLTNTSGWWTSLAAGDFDRDGGIEYVAGNLGLNTRYETSREAPIRIHAKDYDESGSVDPVMTHVREASRYPIHRRDAMVAQIPGLKSRFPTYREYAEASFEEVFAEEEREGAYVQEAVRFETSYLDLKDGGFSIRALPRSVQVAPVFGMQSGDYNRNGRLDLLMVGNWYAPTMRTGRADAFVGAYLQGDGAGHFSVQDGTESGFFVDGDAKGTARVATGDGASIVVVTQNSDSLKAFHPRRPASTRTQSVRPLDQTARFYYENGRTGKVELYYGSGYLSQSSRVLRVPEEAEKVVITNSQGEQRTVTDGRDAPENGSN